MSEISRLMNCLRTSIYDTTWLKAMRRSLGNLVFWPSKEQVTTRSGRFRDIPDICAIIDCTELFIETQKEPALQ